MADMTIAPSATVSVHGAPAVADYPACATFGPRDAHTYEFVWLMSGSARWVCHESGADLLLEPGVLLLVRPGMCDEFRWDDNRPSRHGYVHFTIDPPTPVNDIALTQLTAAPGPLAGLLDYLLWLGQTREPRWQERTADVVGMIMRTFVDGPLPGAAGLAEPPVIAAALDYVRDQWRDGMRPISLTELAAASATSNSHVARSFREHLGIGAVTLLELVRLARGELLLARSNLPVNQIARACGFTDPLHFSRRFRAAYGRSPRAFRQSAGRPTSPLTEAGAAAMVQRLTSPGKPRGTPN